MRVHLAACTRRSVLLGAVLCSLTAPLAGAGPDPVLAAPRASARPHAVAHSPRRAPPHISPAFVSNNGSGAAPWETFTTIDLGAGLHANIQAVNGNLLLTVDGLSLPGVNGLDQSVELHYNSLSHNIGRSAGFGWLLGTAQDVSLEFGGSSVTFYDETGQAYTFAEPSSCVFTPQDGDDAVLACAGSGYTLTKNAAQLQYQFNSAGTLTAIQNRQGNHITFGYNASGNATVITNTEGQATTLSYTGTTTLSTITDPAARVWRYGYDGAGNLSTILNPRGKTSAFGYDSAHRLTQITDPNGNRTLFAYGPNSFSSTSAVTQTVRVTNKVANTGPTWGFGYGATTLVTDTNGHATTYGYDGSQRVTAITDPDSHVTHITWTGDNHIATLKRPSGATTTTSYDSHNNLTQVLLPSGAQANWAYSNGSLPYNVTVFTDTQGHATSYQYNTQGLVTYVTDAATHLITNTYNSNGTLASLTDANGRLTSYGYNSQNLLHTITYPSPLGGATFTYHSFDLVQTQTDGKGQATSYTYNGTGQPITITYAGGSSIGEVYDANGNRLQLTDSTGTTGYMYNALNQQTQQTLPNSATTTYTWDGVNNLLTKIDSGGTITYTYSPENRVSSVTDPQSALTTLGYDQDGNRTSIAYPGGVTQAMGYNGDGALSGITATNSGHTVLASYAYTYTNPLSGLPTTLRYSMSDMAANTTSYSYDALNRLTQALQTNSGGGTIATDRYGFDPAGNMITQTLSGASTTMSYNAANEMTAAGSTTFSYDGNGNQTGSSLGLSLSYNPLNQTSSATPPGGSAQSYTYSDQGQPLRVGAGSTTFQYDVTGLSAMTTITGTTHFIRLPEGTLLEERAPSGSYYYLNDGLGSVMAVVDSSGGVANRYSYDPYGNALSTSETVANPYRFDGQLLDQATGFYKMGTRYYDPTTSRWTQEDALAGFVGNPQTLNRYPFVLGDPINFIDLTGFGPGPATIFLGGVAAGSVAVASLCGYATFATVETGPGALPFATCAVGATVVAGVTGLGAFTANLFGL